MKEYFNGVPIGGAYDKASQINMSNGETVEDAITGLYKTVIINGTTNDSGFLNLNLNPSNANVLSVYVSGYLAIPFVVGSGWYALITSGTLQPQKEITINGLKVIYN